MSTPPEWWATYFDSRYLDEYSPLFSERQDRREVARLVELLELPTGARLLDCPCGQGRHSRLLADAGYRVNGLDYSAELLRHARARGRRSGLSFQRGDMRSLPSAWTGRFEAVLNLFTSFGFFLDPADDLLVVKEFCRVLKPGGLLLWHGGSRDGIMARFLARDWWRADSGALVATERSFDPLSGVLTVRTDLEGAEGSAVREHRIRLYTATRLAELLASVGLVVETAYDGFSGRQLRRTSSSMLLVARKSL